MKTEQIEIIERLRSAALDHGEVSDLLDFLSDIVCLEVNGDPYFSDMTNDEKQRLAAILDAAAFAKYDRKDGGT